MNKYKKLKIEIILLSSAIVWILFSYFTPITNNEAVWFARSGSIMVLFAIIVEFRLSNKVVRKISSTIQTAVIANVPLNVNIQKEQKYVAIIAHVFVVSGTLICGYGDLIK